MSGLHAVSSSDDVKPPLGLKQLSSHSQGPMLSQKRLCCICGDRSSGEKTPSIQSLFSVLISPWKQSGCFLTGLAFPSFPSCHILQANTMASTAVRAVKASSSAPCARIWPIPVGTIKTALWTKDRGTAASTAVTRSAWPWGWRGKVRVETLELLFIKYVFPELFECESPASCAQYELLILKLGMSQTHFCPKSILIIWFWVSVNTLFFPIRYFGNRLKKEKSCP